MSDFTFSCINQRKQRSQFFFHEGGAKSRFTPVCPYIKNSSGELIYTPKQFDMRRKAEILKYIKPNNGNVGKNKYSQLANSTKQNRNKVVCPNDYTPKPTSSSDVPGKIINLYEDPNAPLYNYFPITEQFKFQNIKYDNFKRLFDIFPISNVLSNNDTFQSITTIILLNPNTNQISFDFSIPISLQFNADYNTTTYITTDQEIQEIDVGGNTVYVASDKPYKITVANLSVIDATMEILYSDSIIQTIEASYSSTPLQESSDLRETLASESIDFSNSNSGKVQSTNYLGNIYFKNVILQSISQYVYTIRLKLKVNYSEYTNILSPNTALPYRTNTDGDNISNTNAKNIQNVTYTPIFNIENSSIYISSTTNCTSELFENGENIIPTYIPFNIDATVIRA
jgi:hypothetical protein